jgi:GPH family glycoside/pentoside/hexuronide:cation symporter
MVETTNKVPMGTIIGYGTGALGFAAAANLFFVFFLYFLTTVAGFDPAVSGLIILIAVLWDGVTDPLVGYLSDNSRIRHGKRRPFILMGSIPLCVFTILMFTDVSFLSGTTKQIYFIGINMLFWTFFTTVDIPWATLGSELTDGYNERTKIRTVSSVFLQVGTLLTMVAPPFLIARGTEMYGSEAAGWTFMAAISATGIMAAYLVSWNSTRGREPLESPEVVTQRKQFRLFNQIGVALKNRSMKYLLVTATLLVASFSGIIPAVLLFLIRYNLGLENETDQALYLGIYAVSAIVFTPLAGWVSTRYSSNLGKAKTLGCFALVSAFVLLLGKVVGATPVMTAVMLAAVGLGAAAFWVFVYVLAYDVAAVEAYKTGENKDGIVVAVMSFFLKFGMALGMGLGGVLLGYFGFDENASVQTEAALAGIETVFCLVGGVSVLLGALFCFKFPITQQKYDAIIESHAKKLAGEEYSEAAFADLL